MSSEGHTHSGHHHWRYKNRIRLSFDNECSASRRAHAQHAIEIALRWPAFLVQVGINDLLPRPQIAVHADRADVERNYTESLRTYF